MVRLKDIYSGGLKTVEAKFQFLMVRLKEYP